MFEIQNLKFRSVLDIGHLILDRPAVCLTGESGSGKTTLLRHLNRMYDPDSGRILYNGTDLRTMDPLLLRRKVVMLGQTPVIYDGTIAHNLQIGARFAQQALPDRREMKQALELVELDQDPDSFCDRLSGGEVQRLCMARVMLMQAEVYLMDEPTSALDRKTEHAVMTNLAAFAEKKGRQLILVSHSGQVAGMFPDGVITMEHGRIKEVSA